MEAALEFIAQESASKPLSGQRARYLHTSCPKWCHVSPLPAAYPRRNVKVGTVFVRLLLVITENPLKEV